MTKWCKNTENISISIQSSLLELIDTHNELHDETRASFFKKAAKHYLASKKAESMTFWYEEYQKIKQE